MLWLGGEPEERDEGERESSETGRRLYCCMEEARRGCERETEYMTRRGRGERDGEEAVIIYGERDLYLRCEQIFWASRRKWVNDRTASDGGEY